MTNKTIPDLTAGAAVGAADLFEASQGGASVKLTAAQLLTYVAGGSQPLDATLTALAGVTVATDKGVYGTGADAFATYDLTAGGRALGGVAGTSGTFPYFSAANVVTLGVVTAAGRALIDDADATAQRATLGLVIGTDVQAFNANLSAIAGLTTAANKLTYWTGSGAAALADLTAAGRALMDDADAAAQRVTLGLAFGTSESGWRILGKSAVASSVTGTTTETTLATINVPAGAMGPNGQLRVTALWSMTNNANSKTARARLGAGGPQLFTSIVPSLASQRIIRELGNRNSQTSQVSYGAGITASTGTSTTAVSTFTVDTSAAFDLVLTGTLTNTGDTMTLEQYIVEVVYGA